MKVQGVEQKQVHKAKTDTMNDLKYLSNFAQRYSVVLVANVPSIKAGGE